VVYAELGNSLCRTALASGRPEGGLIDHVPRTRVISQAEVGFVCDEIVVRLLSKVIVDDFLARHVEIQQFRRRGVVLRPGDDRAVRTKRVRVEVVDEANVVLWKALTRAVFSEVPYSTGMSLPW